MSRRWVKAAAIVEAQLEDMLAARGARLQYRWVDDALIELRVVHATMPMSVMLAHPSLSKHLDRAICTLFGEPSVFYVSGGAIRPAHSGWQARLRDGLARWSFPMVLSAGKRPATALDLFL